LPDIPAPFQKETAEYWRLLYVAMTRAQDRLYMTSCKDQKGWMPILSKAFEGTENLDTTDKDDHHDHPKTMVKANQFQLLDCPDWAQDPFLKVTTNHRSAQDDRDNKPILFSTLQSKIWGTALHQILDELPGIDPQHWFKKSQHLLRGKDMSHRRARAWSARLVRLLHRKDLHDLLFDALSERSIVTPQGVIRPDRVLLYDQSVWVVDFKSSHLHGTAPSLSVKGHYWEQMIRYGRAIQGLYPHRSIRLSILWLDNGTLEDVSIHDTGR